MRIVFCPQRRTQGALLRTDTALREMQTQSFSAALVHGGAFANLLQAVPHQHLVVGGREQRGGYGNEDADPGVVVIGKGLPAEEDGGHDACAQVTRHVCADGDVRKAPDHCAVHEADGPGSDLGRDERIGRVQARPDDDADVRVDEEFDEEQVTEVCLCGAREGAEDAGGPAVEDGA